MDLKRSIVLLMVYVEYVAFTTAKSRPRITVNITGDNDLWFYADGQAIVDSNTPDYNNWGKTKHVSVPADTKVYGVKCIDHGVVAGIIASFSDGTVTDASWRCTKKNPGAGWLSENYDDSSWQSAYTIHTNDHSSSYWGVRIDISSNAKWIWTRGWHGQDRTVYCRKVVNGPRITVNITGDNDLWFYADGQAIVDSNTPDYNNWGKTKHVSVPADTKVYGVKCIDHGVVGGIIASFSDGTVTDASWRCTKKNPGAGWLSENYDDSSWPSAYTIHTNDHSSSYWGVRSDISSNAKWIWTRGWHGQDRTVYCRKVVNGPRIMVNITGDNDLWFYADGQAIVDSNTPEQ